jgi:hypothetical protein
MMRRGVSFNLLFFVVLISFFCFFPRVVSAAGGVWTSIGPTAYDPLNSKDDLQSETSPSQSRNVKSHLDERTLFNKVSGLQIPFIENQGQIEDASVRFFANIFDGTVFVNDKGEMTYNFFKREKTTWNKKADSCEFLPEEKVSRAVAVKESLVSPEHINVKGLRISNGKVNYFIGAKGDWKTNVPTWQEVDLGEVYKGIELKLRAYGKTVEKIFTVSKGGNVKDIELTFEGARKIHLNKAGELELETDLGTVKLTKPVAFQDEDGKKKFIHVAYNVTGDANTYGFEVGSYDKTKPLIIDPLLASTFAGSSSSETARAIAIDTAGNVFITGITNATNYPATLGGYDTGFNGVYDIFVSKFNNDLTSLLASTFIGGSSNDEGNAVAVDPSGKVYIAGNSRSSNYPVTTGAKYKASNDVVVSKFSNDLSTLEASTIIGGFG